MTTSNNSDNSWLLLGGIGSAVGQNPTPAPAPPQATSLTPPAPVVAAPAPAAGMPNLPAWQIQSLESLAAAGELSGVTAQEMAVIIQAESGGVGGSINSSGYGGWLGLSATQAGSALLSSTSQAAFESQAKMAAADYAALLAQYGGNPLEAEQAYQTGSGTGSESSGTELMAKYVGGSYVGGSSTTSPYGNIGQPNQTYLTTVTGSSVGQAIGDLTEFGLSPDQAQQALSWYTTEEKNLVDPAQMQVDMYQQPWFQQAFPGIIQQIKNGQAPMSPADYVAFKQGVLDFSSQYGIPKGFISDGDIANMVGQGWTFKDFETRMGIAFNNSAQALVNNPEAMNILDQWYGIKPGSGALAAFFLDPHKTVALLQQATTAAQAGASAQTAGYQPLDQKTLMSLAATHSLSEMQTGINSGVGLLPTQKATQGPGGPGNSVTTTSPDILAAELGGIPGQETAQQGIQKVNLAAGQRNQGLGGGGGFQGQGATGASGAGYGTQ